MKCKARDFAEQNHEEFFWFFLKKYFHACLFLYIKLLKLWLITNYILTSILRNPLEKERQNEAEEEDLREEEGKGEIENLRWVSLYSRQEQTSRLNLERNQSK